MCGRFVSSSSPDKIAEYFGASFEGSSAEPAAAAGAGAPAPAADLPANYNVAPTNDVWGVVAGSDGRPALQVFHWGLVPLWAKDTKIGSKMINARSETIAEKPAFKSDFKKHRVIIPMDGFYEWKQGSEGAALTKAGKPAKQPYFIHRVDGEPLAVAGVWSLWRDKAAGPDAPWLHSCAVITTSANHTMEPIHDRMPVLLAPSQWQQWLDPGNTDVESLQELLVPAPDDLLTMYPVSTDVNNVRNKGADLIEPVEPVDAVDRPEAGSGQGSLQV